jgi:hypothetical protein
MRARITWAGSLERVMLRKSTTRYLTRGDDRKTKGISHHPAHTLMKIQYVNGFDPEVFALTNDEKNFGPDDTAWQFLRLNPQYRKAFIEATHTTSNPKALDKILSYIAAENLNPETIAYTQDDTCQKQFGIAVWLDPACERLPRLIDPDDSWFFPLKRVEQQDSALSLKQRGLSPKNLDWFPWLTVQETPFGYGSILGPGPGQSYPIEKKKQPYARRLIHIAFDCSIPVDGQVQALEVLARKHREFWSKRICSTTAPTVLVEPIGWHDVFEVSDFINPNLARTVAIDALGARKMQIKRCRKLLDDAYRRLDKESQRWRKEFSDLPNPNEIRHFGERFPMPKPSLESDPAPYTNRYLKALLMIARRLPDGVFNRTRNIADDVGLAVQIAERIGISGDDVPPPAWMDDFADGLQHTHLRRARNLVHDLYKWLVHAQVSFSGNQRKSGKYKPC